VKRRRLVAAALALAAVACARRGPAACDVAKGPCSTESSGVGFRLELAPRPVRPLSELEALVDLTRGGAPLEQAEVSLRLSMPGMYMGHNRAELRSQGGGRYRGRIALVRCMSGRADWVAEVTARPPGGAEASARFPFEASE